MPNEGCITPTAVNPESVDWEPIDICEEPIIISEDGFAILSEDGEEIEAEEGSQL